ncbi:MAG: hypothetical protein JRI57_05970 [Deltaproteobacteria bacterium]|nr:hypothetical protein [Deltaproteobacteria bacterium]MBW1953138.1 hypothetical protein [Deltaproteobacteria bacterium]MBW1987017.1 hypothetical protein [Deltaproteobacteria bacterium]MBW2134026.1 hypothetical protein [Deltaproteobacteria bacterium]
MSRMISDLKRYFNDLVPSRDELLVELEQETEQEKIPIVGPAWETELKSEWERQSA